MQFAEGGTEGTVCGGWDRGYSLWRVVQRVQFVEVGRQRVQWVFMQFAEEGGIEYSACTVCGGGWVGQRVYCGYMQLVEGGAEGTLCGGGTRSRA